MSEIRILTAVGQTIVITADKPGQDVKDLAEDIYRNGFRVPSEAGGSIMQVVAVEYTAGSFASQIIRPTMAPKLVKN